VPAIDTSPVINRIADLVHTVPGAKAAVACQPLDLASAPPLLWNASAAFHAASLVKVPVMIELFRRATDRTLDLDDAPALTNDFASLVNDGRFALSPVDDSEKDLYQRIGSRVSLRLLCELMITRSSNLATNSLMQLLGPAAVQTTAAKLGAGAFHVIRGVEDRAAFDLGLNNTTTAAAVLELFRAIGRSEPIDADASAAMIGMLSRQTIGDGIPGGLPAGIRVAHKTGNTTDVHHDAGIVFDRRPYVLAILTRGIPDRAISARLIADVTRVVDRFFRGSV
jgi:beta-lactamase class A